jgi:tRNA A37 threonylcarbamoyladenosine dehydratase
LGRYKSEVIKGKILRINPEADVEAYTRKLSFDELGEKTPTY